MHPVLFTLPGGFAFHTYGFVLAVAFILGLELTTRRAKKEGLPWEKIFPAGIVTLVGALLGAKIFFIFFEPGGLKELTDLSSLARGGLVWYGGIIGGAAAYFLAARLYRLPAVRVLDVAAPYVALGYGIHRLAGCFSAGCCYGKPTDAAWGVVFPPGSQAARAFGEGVAVHPTQIYLAAVGFLMFFALLWMRGRKKQDGEVAWLFFVLYALARPFVEIFRAGSHRAADGGWLTAPPQMTSWIILGICSLLLFRSVRLGKNI
jgi:phosphatidylglycerol:prolipoprotein diacylglycerol transferase